MSTDNQTVTKRLLVESDPHQTRVAVLENDRLTEIHMERLRKRSVVGNVYKGRISRILPGMQAAFVDIGLVRDAFLYVGDVRDAISDQDELADADPQTRDFPPLEQKPIESLLHEGQEIVVQVVKAPLPNKGARITTEITLPGRYVVLVPTVRNIGISRRIVDTEERERLREILERTLPAEGGIIVRTAGEGKGEQEFTTDLEFLRSRWENIQSASLESSAPELLHEDQDLVLRAVRDRFTDDFSELMVDGTEAYERIVEFAGVVAPWLSDRIRLCENEGLLFTQLGIDREIDAALKSKVWLKSGGYIVINPTEALVAIDVNTGRFIGKKTLEETVLQTNLEAVEEIARQIRLRDLSGIIVVDLIDMAEIENRERVFSLLQQELGRDRAKHQVLSVSDFGLVEITRKRSRENLSRILTRPCPECGGSGRILSATTICLKLRREILSRGGELADRKLVVRVHPEVLWTLEADHHDVLEELREALGEQLSLEADESLQHEKYTVTEV
jgi:ribonuclease G